MVTYADHIALLAEARGTHQLWYKVELALDTLNRWMVTVGSEENRGASFTSRPQKGKRWSCLARARGRRRSSRVGQLDTCVWLDDNLSFGTHFQKTKERTERCLAKRVMLGASCSL